MNRETVTLTTLFADLRGGALTRHPPFDVLTGASASTRGLEPTRTGAFLIMPKRPATSSRSVVCTHPLAQMLLASALAGGASALTGCTAGSSSGQMATLAAPEHVGTTRSALTNPNEYTWSQGQVPQVLESMNSAFCYLTGVSGRFRGEGESVHVTASNGYWVLTGSSGQVGVAGRARCVPWSNFNNPSWSVGWDGWVESNGNCAFYETCTAETLSGPGTFCSLSGVAGRLMGGDSFSGPTPSDCNQGAFGNFGPVAGDMAMVQWSNPDNAYVLSAGPYPCSLNGWRPTISGWSECMSFPPTVWVSSYYTVTDGGRVDMGATTDEFCALTGVTGYFNGSGESVTISQQTSGGAPCLDPASGSCDWILSASDSQISATALCAYYP
jgi:hypothetical protein